MSAMPGLHVDRALSRMGVMNLCMIQHDWEIKPDPYRSWDRQNLWLWYNWGMIHELGTVDACLDGSTEGIDYALQL